MRQALLLYREGRSAVEVLFQPLEAGKRAVDSGRGAYLHSGPTPRGKLLDATRLLCVRVLKSTNASIRRMFSVFVSLATDECSPKFH